MQGLKRQNMRLKHYFLGFISSFFLAILLLPACIPVSAVARASYWYQFPWRKTEYKCDNHPSPLPPAILASWDSWVFSHTDSELVSRASQRTAEGMASDFWSRPIEITVASALGCWIAHCNRSRLPCRKTLEQPWGGHKSRTEGSDVCPPAPGNPLNDCSPNWHLGHSLLSDRQRKPLLNSWSTPSTEDENCL